MSGQVLSQSALPSPLRREPADGSSSLVARDDELSVLVAALRERRSTIVIGDAGTGKTALVNQALAFLRAEDPQIRVLTVHAHSADQANLAEALDPLMREFPQFSPDDVLAAVRAASHGTQLVLRIEDAHLLDDVSRRQVGWLVREGKVSVVVTLRRAAGSQWPWLDLWRNACADRVDVEVFGQAEVQEYLESILAGAVSVAVGWRLWKATGGVPERVVAVVRDELVRERLRLVDGVWHWIGMAEPDQQLMAVVKHDLAALAPPARATLELMAVLGPVPYGLLFDLAPPAALETLQHQGLVTTSLTPTSSRQSELMANLMHPSYAEAVRSMLSRERSIQLFGEVAHLIDDPDLHPELQVSLVTFALRSGVVVPPAGIRRALDQIFGTSLGQGAISIIDQAIELGVPEELRAELLLRRAVAMRQLGKVSSASRDLEQVDLVIAGLSDGTSLALQAVQVRADLMHFNRNDADGAGQMLDDAMINEHSIKALTVQRTTHALWSGLRGEHQERALSLLRGGSTSSVHVPLVAPAVLARAQGGAPDAAVALADSFFSETHDAPHIEPLEQVATSVVCLLVGLWAGRYLEVSVPDPGRAGDPDGSWHHFVSGHTAISQGVWSLAERELHAYSVTLSERDPLGLRGYVDAVHALAAAAAGDRGHAHDLIDRSSTLPLGRWGALESEMRLLRLDASIWLGEPDSLAQARELVEWTHERGDVRVELEAMHRHCRLQVRDSAPVGAVTQSIETIRELAPLVDGRRAELLVRHAEATIRDDIQMVEMYERGLNECGLWLPPLQSTSVATLTHREREIAHMAAGGMSSKAIAARLVLSVRTVDTHLARAYSKFGVHSRDELSKMLRRGDR